MADPLKQPWYKLDDDDEAMIDFADHCKTVEQNQSSLFNAFRAFVKLYSGRDELGLDWGTNSRSVYRDDVLYNNIIQQTIDTCVAVAARDSVRLRGQVRNGQWSDRTLAKRLERYHWGEYIHNREADRMVEQLRDALILGTGTVGLAYSGKGKDLQVVTQRCHTWNIIVDETQCTPDRRPLEVMERYPLPKSVLCALFPKFEKEIAVAGSDRYSEFHTIPDDNVVFFKGWRPAIEGRDGHYIVGIEDKCFERGKWTLEHSPHTFFSWEPAQTGFYGTPVTERLIDLQLALIDLDNHIKESQDLTCVPRVIVPGGTQFNVESLDDVPGRILTSFGGEPKFFTPSALPAEVYNQRMSYINEAPERVGLNKRALTADIPSGLETGNAVREFAAIRDDRFIHQTKRWHTSHVDLGWRRFEMAAQAYKGKKLDGLLGEIDWAEVSEKQQRYIITVAPASLMPEMPSGRRQLVMDMFTMGAIDAKTMQYFVENPDIEFMNSMTNADYEDATAVVEILGDGEYEDPEPTQNLMLTMKLVNQANRQAKRLKAPEKTMRMFRTWLSNAKGLIQRAQQQLMMEQQQQMMAAQGVAPPGAPLGPPQTAAETGPAMQGPPNMEPNAVTGVA